MQHEMETLVEIWFLIFLILDLYHFDMCRLLHLTESSEPAVINWEIFYLW